MGVCFWKSEFVFLKIGVCFLKIGLCCFENRSLSFENRSLFFWKSEFVSWKSEFFFFWKWEFVFWKSEFVFLKIGVCYSKIGVCFFKNRSLVFENRSLFLWKSEYVFDFCPSLCSSWVPRSFKQDGWQSGHRRLVQRGTCLPILSRFSWRFSGQCHMVFCFFLRCPWLNCAHSGMVWKIS